MEIKLNIKVGKGDLEEQFRCVDIVRLLSGRRIRLCRILGSVILPTSFRLISCLTYSSTVKMEAACSSETSVDFQHTTWCYIQENITIQAYDCWNIQITRCTVIT
jgi:hypothetical protein